MWPYGSGAETGHAAIQKFGLFMWRRQMLTTGQILGQEIVWQLIFAVQLLKPNVASGGPYNSQQQHDEYRIELQARGCQQRGSSQISVSIVVPEFLNLPHIRTHLILAVA